MMPEIFRKINIAFTIQNCPHCRILNSFIERINYKLPSPEKIRMVDCTYAQKYGINNEILSLFGKSFDGFPTVFIHGIKIIGANSKVESYETLHALLCDKLIVRESNENKFIKQCEFNKKGAFKNRVICNDM